MKEKLTQLLSVFGLFKKHWRTPAEGDYVPYREFMAYIFGAGGIQITNQLFALLSFSSGCLLVCAIFNINIQHIYFIGLIGMPLGYLTSPIHMMITDNLGVLSKKMNSGLSIAGIICTLLAVVLWFVPQIRFEEIFKLPEIPKIISVILISNVIGFIFKIYTHRWLSPKYGKFRPWYLTCGIPMFVIMLFLVFSPIQSMEYNKRLIVVYLLFSLLGIFTGPFTTCFQQFTNVMSPNTEERTRLMSYGSFIYSLFPSIINIALPMVVQMLGGYTTLRTYKVIVPVLCTIGISLSLCMFFGVKEKVVVAKSHKAEVKFWSASKSVLTNKYFWIQNLSGLGNAVFGGSVALVTIMFVYGIRRDGMMGVANAVLGNAYVPGMLLAPWIIRKMGKRNLILVSKAFYILGMIATIFIIRGGNIFFFIAIQYLICAITSSSNIAVQAIPADILDYQQWKTGERMEGFTGIFGYIINPVTMILGYIMPFLYAKCGLTSDWDILFNVTVRNNVLVTTIMVTIVGTLVGTIPYVFYDLSEKKHKQIILELGERARLEDEQNVNIVEVTS